MQRRTGILGIVLLLVLFASGAFLTARLLLGGRVPGLARKRVAVLPIVGIIDSETRFVRELQAFRDDPSVRAFVLEIRSPGGLPNTLTLDSMIYRQFTRNQTIASFLSGSGYMEKRGKCPKNF